MAVAGLALVLAVAFGYRQQFDQVLVQVRLWVDPEA